MKWLGYKQAALKSLIVDAADIRKRMKSAHIADLAQNIRDSGDDLIHAPTVRAGTKELLCGRDRLAALLMLKVKKAWVHLVDCDDREAKELEVWENVYRRPISNRAELLASLVAQKEQEIKAKRGAEGGTVSPAPQQSVKAEARRQVARAAGVSPASVKKAEQRAAAKESAAGAGTPLLREPAASAAEPALSPEPGTLDLLGCDDNSARAVAKFARKDQDAIDEADKYLRLAQTALTHMTPGTVQQQLHADVHRVASRVRSHRPDAICPWCKGLPKSEAGACQPCGGAGYVSEEVAGRAPGELVNADAPMVAIDGKFYPYPDVRDGKTKPAKNGTAKKAEKRISAVDGEGNEIPLDADEAY